MTTDNTARVIKIDDEALAVVVEKAGGASAHLDKVMAMLGLKREDFKDKSGWMMRDAISQKVCVLANAAELEEMVGEGVDVEKRAATMWPADLAAEMANE